MFFKQISSGGDRNFSYLIACDRTKLAVVVDPSPDPLKVVDEISEFGVRILYVINTHSHVDHTSGNDYFKSKKGAEIVTFSGGDGDVNIGDGGILNVGDVTLKFIHTPGHTPDSICILTDENLITGDTLFVGKVGGTYTEEDALAEFESLKRLIDLPETIKVWPGHDYGISVSSTIENEKMTNPFMQRLNDFNDFLWLKQNWASYKVEHGIK